MTADQPPEPPQSPEAPPPFPDGKRKPPTIDLTATEVETGPVAEAVSEPAVDDAAPAVAAADAPPPNEPPPESPAPESPAPETASAPKSAAEPPPASPPPPRRRSAAGLIGAGIVGGAVAAGAVFAANLFLVHDNDTSALEARLAGVELELRELRLRGQGVGGQGAAAAADPHALDELTARIAKLEETVAAPKPAPLDPALANRISAIEGQTKAIDERLGILARRNDEIAALAGEAKARAEAAAAAAADLARKLSAQPTVSKADLDALAARLATTQQELGKLAARPPGDDRVSRLAIATTALRSVVERGEPYVAELAAVKAHGADATSLAALEPFASTGVPSARVLAREISDLAPALLQAAGGAPRDGSFLERLQLNAERLVRIRRVEEAPGTDPASIIARVEVKAAHGDLAGALTELVSLPEAARAPAEAWIKKAQARAAAVDAARRLSADALAGLSK